MAESKITVSLRQCRNLHSSQHAEKWFARVEFGANVLGESERMDRASGEAFEVGLDITLSCSASDPKSLDEIISNPVLVSLLEVLPKDKKAKEEKTNVLGQTAVDLLPLLLGESPLRLTRQLHHPSGQEGSPGAGGEGGGKPELDVEVSVSQPILSEEQVAQSNILTLRLRSLHSLPDSWQPGTFPFTFTLALPLPSSPPHITLPNGILKLGPDKDPGAMSSQWRWPSLPSAMGGASLVEGSHMKTWALEEEQGEVNSKEDLKFRRSAECSHPQAIWQVERRCWLPPKANSTLLQNLSQCSLWPCEVGRVSVPGGGGKGRGKEEEPTLSCHAVTYLDLTPLLYPGATQIIGAYPLQPFSEPEVAEKTKREYTAILPSLISSTPAAGAGKKAGPTAAAKRPASSARLASSSTVATEEEGGGAGEGEGKSESHVYVDARSYLFLEVEMHRPLIPKRPASVLAERISEYIPPRPPLPRQLGGAERAVQDFHTQTATITDTLLQEYRELFGEGVASGALSESGEAVDERRRKLLFHLNSSGKYHAFKEQLKHSVVNIVREKYLNQVGAGQVGGANSHAFLSELYVFLTDQMHAGLRKVLSLEDPAPPPPSVLDSELLRHFAVEAEVCRDYELADRYYKERVSQADHVASHWYDYGVFCLLVGDLDKSEQCFREAVALNQRMVPALLLYGMVCCLDERYSEAEQFFEMATTTDPENVIAWTMRGLYYEHSGNGVYEDMCFQEASKLNFDRASRTFIAPQVATGGQKGVPPGPGTQSKVCISGKQQVSLKHPSTTSIVGGATEQTSVTQAAAAVIQSTKSLGGGVSSHKLQNPATISRQSSTVPEDQPTSQQTTTITESATTLAHEDKSKLSTQQSLTKATADQTGTEGIPTDDPNSPPAGPEQSQRLADNSMASMGSRQSGNREPPETQPRRTVSIFLQTASYLLDVHALKFGEMSLAHDLTLPAGGPSPQHLVAQARLHLLKEEWGREEQCLRSAIEQDFQDSNAWALLGHTLYLTGDYASARDAYERTIHYVNPPTYIHAVYIRLGDIYLREQEYDKAKEMFLHACRRSPSSITWRGVGISCYRLGDLSQAEDALCEANILNNLDPTVWGYLTLVCMKTERPVEAEQALKFAIKAGLSDSPLNDEIQALQRTQPQLSNLSQIPKAIEVA